MVQVIRGLVGGDCGKTQVVGVGRLIAASRNRYFFNSQEQ